MFTEMSPREALENLFDTLSDLWRSVFGRPVSSWTIEEERERNIWQKAEVQRIMNLSNFNDAQWNRYSNDEASWKANRERILNEFLAELQIVLNTSVRAEIDFNPRLSRNGQFRTSYRRPYSGIVVIRNTDTTRLTGLRTVAHELRHGYQRESFDNPGRHRVADETNQAWRRNWRSQVSRGYPNALHMESAIEWDAYYFAGQITRYSQFRNHTPDGAPLAPLRLLRPINYLSWYETRWW
jgi:hypothetical protein